MFNLLAQTYSYSTNTSDGGGAAAAAFGGAWLLFWLAITVALIAGMWKMFKKAGEPGWAAIVPIYNSYVQLKIAGRPAWWLILLLIPFVNIVIGVLVGIDIAKRFGHSDVFGAIVCGLLGIGYTIIGFDSSTYQGGGTNQVANNLTQTPPTPPAPTATPQY
jgi:uncharacterized membrane protein YhaH (DUF805 family)